MINRKIEKLQLLKSKALVLSMITSISLLSGCSNKVDCDIRSNHTHVYINEEGYKRNINSEKLMVDGYDRTDEYDLYYDEDLVKFISKKDLLVIDDNLDIINQVQNENKDFIEYRYKYTTLMPMYHKIGKTTTVSYYRVTHYSWTKDKNHSRLTGETRLCHPMYQAYKIEKNEKGKFVLIPSSLVDDLNEIKDEYSFIKKDYCKIVNLETNNEVDYEDGQFEDDERIVEKELKLERRKINYGKEL